MNGIIDFIRDALPVRMEAAYGAVTGAVGVMGEYLFGEWNSALETLVVFMIADYVSGLLAAYIDPRSMLDSRVGFKGICKKIMILLLVAMAHCIDRATGQAIICTAVTWFFLGNEGLSILENAAKTGLPIPQKLRDTLAQLADEKHERREEAK